MAWMIYLLAFSVFGEVTSQCNSTSYRLNNGTCLPCPERCSSCTSQTNCIMCKEGNYGSQCQHRCPIECDGLCHKTFGHCTSGCKDGTFPGGGRCSNCSGNCKLCTSASDCVICKTGFFGNGCERPCPDGCIDGEPCKKETGQCKRCENGTYIKSERCLKCPESCARCEDSSTCSECNKGYHGPYYGKCFKDCEQTEENDVVYFPSNNDCIKTEGNITDIVDHCDAVLGANAYQCVTSLHCVNFTSCPSREECTPTSGFSDDGRYCGTIMLRRCTHDCRICTQGYATGECAFNNGSSGYTCLQRCSLGIIEDDPRSGNNDSIGDSSGGSSTFCVSSAPSGHKLSHHLYSMASVKCNTETPPETPPVVKGFRHLQVIISSSCGMVVLAVIALILVKSCHSRFFRKARNDLTPPVAMATIDDGRRNQFLELTGSHGDVADSFRAESRLDMAEESMENYDTTFRDTRPTGESNIYDHAILSTNVQSNKSAVGGENVRAGCSGRDGNAHASNTGIGYLSMYGGVHLYENVPRKHGGDDLYAN